jgi:HSP20 family molecular chaperone IbpA
VRGNESAKRLKGASDMVRMTTMSSPFLLGFDEIERALERATKVGADGYPPYNIERLPAGEKTPERLRITLAVAGFSLEDIEVTQEESQLWIKGRQREDKSREYIHRGIAARQFQRNFLLAEGMQVLGAELASGLLSIDVAKPQPDKVVKKINILARD